MKNRNLSFCSLLALSWNVSGKKAEERSTVYKGWKFIWETLRGFTASFDDLRWSNLTLPHDWLSKGSFCKDNLQERRRGNALVALVGMNNFSSFHRQKQKVVCGIDGVYMNSESGINGHHLGIPSYGYISFQYDITPYLISMAIM
jgi:beta-galactosidase